MVAKTLCINLFTTPYTFQNTQTAMRLARAALARGYRVKVFAYGDGVHNFTSGQRPRGVPNPEEGFTALAREGLQVELCGTCLNFRGLGEAALMEEAAPSSMKNLCEIIRTSEVFVTLAF